MSSLKKDIEEVLLEFRADYITSERATTQIINLIESVLPEEKDLDESATVHTQVAVLAYNQAISDIKSKLIGGSNGTE